MGYLFSKYRDISKIYDELDQYLSIYVYEKIWSALPKNERALLKCFSKEVMTTEELLALVPYDNQTYCVYRGRLIKRGLIDGVEYGKNSLTLPRFVEFIRRQTL